MARWTNAHTSAQQRYLSSVVRVQFTLNPSIAEQKELIDRLQSIANETGEPLGAIAKKLLLAKQD